MAVSMLMRRLQSLTATPPLTTTVTARLFCCSSGKYSYFPSTIRNRAVNDLGDGVSDGGDGSGGGGGGGVLVCPSLLVSPNGKRLSMPDLLQPRVVVYDGVCHLCHRGVKWVIEADKYRKIKFCCLQSKAAEPYLRLCGLDRQDVLRRFLFVEGYGLYHQGSAAALRVMSHLPLPYAALSALLIVPTPLRDAVYDYIAKRRYNWFGKAEDCLVLKEQDLLDRFIDRDEMMDKSRSKL